MQFFKTIKSFLPKKTSSLLLVAGLFCFTAIGTSCGSNKTGCPVNDRAKNSSVNKKGQLSNKKGSSNLFPKKVRKKMRT